jgi:cephalosporin-C deacetylase-like acetyl esterase
MKNIFFPFILTPDFKNWSPLLKYQLMKKKSLFLVFVFFAFASLICKAQEDLNVLTGKWLQYGNARNSLYNHLSSIAYDQLAERGKKISGISSPSGWQQWQKSAKAALLKCTGAFPAKTPLNAKTVRTINKGSFRVEHVIFQSIPGFYVTASLYLPSGLKKNAKVPAIIYCSGHSVDGYRSDVYQHVILNLVFKGFIVLAFDPVGQGERLEYFDQKTGKSSVGGPTSEHSYPGAQAFLTGSSQAYYMIWDGIRAVDYLLERKEVDPSRIGITGRSGGGTQSAMIAAFDERIYAAAPENYLTNYTRLLQTIGPQDAEQNLFNFISNGLDHPDFLLVRAPKPALMITTTSDMFSIQGAMETEKEVGRIYQAFGKAENFSRCSDDAGHESTRKNREAMYAFFQKHLNNPGNPSDENIPLLTKDELRVTETGQVSLSPGSETVFSLNLNEAVKLNGMVKSNVVKAARDLSGYIDPRTEDEPVFTGRIKRSGYSIEKYFIKGEGDYVLPYLLFIPEEKTGKAMIYLHPGGKAAEAGPGGEIEQIVNQGIVVMAADLAGLGELGPGDLKGDANFKGISHNIWYASMLIGRSITGLQAGDVTKLARILKKSVNAAQISGFAAGGMAPVLLHSALLSDEIGSIVLKEPYSSYIAIVSSRYYNPAFIMSSVPGALKYYDLPDLEAAFSPHKLYISGTVDGNNTKTGKDRMEKDLDVISNAYSKAGAANMLQITVGSPDYKVISAM